jgi:hypothetical protein
MPNWCRNTLEVSGPEETVHDFVAQVRGHGFILWSEQLDKRPIRAGVLLWPMRQILDFARILPVPREIVWAGFNEAGYDWCVTNWGTKWNATDIDLSFRHNKSKKKLTAIYGFYTAWSPPIGFVDAAADRYPTLRFKFSYREEDGGRGGFVIHRAKGINRVRPEIGGDETMAIVLEALRRITEPDERPIKESADSVIPVETPQLPTIEGWKTLDEGPLLYRARTLHAPQAPRTLVMIHARPSAIDRPSKEEVGWRLYVIDPLSSESNPTLTKRGPFRSAEKTLHVASLIEAAVMANREDSEAQAEIDAKGGAPDAEDMAFARAEFYLARDRNPPFFTAHRKMQTEAWIAKLMPPDRH